MADLKTLTEAKIASGRKSNPKFMAGVDAIIDEAKVFQQGANAIKIGEKAPHFSLPNAQGEQVDLEALVKQGPLVITFYRGNWCPYCNLQLRALQERLGEIKALGASLVAISPQVPDGSMTADDISKMDFIVLSDQDAKVASQYGVAWEVPEFLMEHMRVDRQLDLEKINNGNAHVLPIPATFILDRNATVIWNYVNVDYRTRSEPEDIIKALQKMS